MAKAVSTLAIAHCQQQDLASANAALNAAYRQKMASLPASRQTALRQEERAWIAQRDRTCATKPDSGTSGPIAGQACVLEQTRMRTQALKAMP